MTWGNWSPHKFKIGISGCPRNCAEASIKDLGVFCVDSGFEILIGGHGGIELRGTDKLCHVATQDEVLEYCAAFMQLYREEARSPHRSPPLTPTPSPPLSAFSAEALLGIPPSTTPAAAEAALDTTGFAVVPLEALSPEVAGLLALRGVLGLRSSMNTVGRLLDPADATGSIDGVFHPAYIALHLGAAGLLGRRVSVLKGGGGQAEWTGVKPLLVTTRNGEQL